MLTAPVLPVPKLPPLSSACSTPTVASYASRPPQSPLAVVPVTAVAAAPMAIARVVPTALVATPAGQPFAAPVALRVGGASATSAAFVAPQSPGSMRGGSREVLRELRAVEEECRNRRPTDPFFYPTTLNPLTSYGLSNDEQNAPSKGLRGNESASRLGVQQDESGQPLFVPAPIHSWMEQPEAMKRLQQQNDSLAMHIQALEHAKSQASAHAAQAMQRIRQRQEQMRREAEEACRVAREMQADIDSPAAGRLSARRSDRFDGAGAAGAWGGGCEASSSSPAQQRWTEPTAIVPAGALGSAKVADRGVLDNSTSSGCATPTPGSFPDEPQWKEEVWQAPADVLQPSTWSQATLHASEQVTAARGPNEAADALDATPASRSSWPPQEISQFASSILSAHNAPGSGSTAPRSQWMPTPENYVDALGRPLVSSALRELPNIKDELPPWSPSPSEARALQRSSTAHGADLRAGSEAGGTVLGASCATYAAPCVDREALTPAGAGPSGFGAGGHHEGAAESQGDFETHPQSEAASSRHSAALAPHAHERATPVSTGRSGAGGASQDAADRSGGVSAHRAATGGSATADATPSSYAALGVEGATFASAASITEVGGAAMSGVESIKSSSTWRRQESAASGVGARAKATARAAAAAAAAGHERAASVRSAHPSSGSGATAARSPESEELQAELEECLDTIRWAASSIGRESLQDKSLAKPAPIVREVFEVVAMLLGQPQSRWDQLKKFIGGDTFLTKIQRLNFQQNVTKEQFRKLREHLGHQEFDEEFIKTVCVPVVPLAMWCRAIGFYLSKTKFKGGAEIRPVAAAGASQTPQRSERSQNGNTNEQYYMVFDPDIERMDADELRRVENLSISRPGVGSITFIGDTDCTGIDFERVVRLEVGEVLVYPDSAQKPPVGIGLNKPATVTMYQCWPPSGSKLLQDPKSQERYKKKIKQMTEEKHAHFIDYDCSTGVWQFSVDHF